MKQQVGETSSRLSKLMKQQFDETIVDETTSR